ncbi:hypothetical protein LMG24238_04776 [Paraburkholderia sediminicola]|uniref:Uncharacterized protein n=1 Tax=Paraburkholderia sediminicola TaxID=458836 RepID=A0A6J5BYV4_9BURK|nr:hypothetical protein LMG24238_04776 [Paraburkholderia sediminicola]
MCESTDSSRTTTRSGPRCPLSISGLSRFLCLSFFAAAKKVSAAPHRGNANRPLTNQGKARKPEQGKANAQGKQKRSPAQAKKSTLPKAIPSNSLQHPFILANSNSTPNLDRRIQPPTPLNHLRQIPTHMPTLPKKHRHNSHNRTPVGDKIPHSGRQVRLHQLKKSQQHRPGIRTARSAHLLSEPLKRLPPPHIPRAMRKQHKSMRSHDKGP